MAVITISNTGGNWNATGTWVGGVVPVAADSVIATATSGPLTVTANATINGVNFTNYTNTFTINSGVTLSQGAGSATSQPFTFVSGMTVAGTGTLSFNGTFTMTSGGKVWTGNLRFAPQGSGASRTITLGDNWTIEGNLEFIPGTSLTQVVNGAGLSITARGNLTVGSATQAIAVQGTAGIILAPPVSTTCTISTPYPNTSGNNNLRNSLTINGAGSVLFNYPNKFIDFGSITHTSSAGVTVTASTELRFTVASTLSINAFGVIAGDIRFNGTATFTLANNIQISGTLFFGNSLQSISPTLSGSTINLTGNLTTLHNAGGQVVTGTTIINVTSVSPTFTLTGATLPASARFGLDLIINCSGTVTFFSTNNLYGGAGRSFTHTSGTIVFTQPNANWWTVSGSTTYNLNSAIFPFPNFFAATGGAPIFAGSQGATFRTYNSSVAGLTHTFSASKTYTVNEGITLAGTEASRISFVSSVPSTQAVFTVVQGATIDVGYVNPTDIDSSQGQTVWDYRGTFLRTTNWQQLPVQPTTISSFNI